ncbi:MAG: substrate-binding domain-containing protein [Pseudomonadota bacterium]
MIRALIFICLVWGALGAARADDQRFLLATTTSTENSGLLDVLVPAFTEDTGIRIDVVAIGTGQALELGRRGDAAALLTHDRVGEIAFITNGHGTDRRDVMYNDFVIIGPAADPADIQNAATVAQALQRIAGTGATFLSRGDDSGTHRRELRLWAEADLKPENFDGWYREAGSGMGQTLLTAIEMQAYTLSDRGTWISFARKQELAILFENEPPLLNPYSSILVSNALLPEPDRQAARQWHIWLTSQRGQEEIANFKIEGQQLFFPAAAGD